MKTYFSEKVVEKMEENKITEEIVKRSLDVFYRQGKQSGMAQYSNVDFRVGYDEAEKRQFSIAEEKSMLDKAIVKLVVEKCENAEYTKLFNAKKLDKLSRRKGFQEEYFAMAETLIEAVLPNALLLGGEYYTDSSFVSLGEGKTYTVESNALYTVMEGSNAVQYGYSQRDESIEKTLFATKKQIDLTFDYYKIITGQKSMLDFIFKAVYSIEGKMNEEAYNVLVTAMEALPMAISSDLTTELRVTGYTEKRLLVIGQKVGAYNGSRATVLGTKVALANVLPVNSNYQYNLESPYVTMGYINNFKGMDLVELQQVAKAGNSRYDLVLDDTKLYIISTGSDKIVKRVISGGIEITTNDNAKGGADHQLRIVINGRWGTASITNAIAGLITIG